MRLLKRIINQLQIIGLRRKTKSKISFSAKVNKKTFLEGGNKIGSANIRNSIIGKYSYVVSGNVSNAKIGRFCSIGPGLNCVSACHPINFVSTYPGFYNTKNKDIVKFSNYQFTEQKSIENCSFIVGNDVWIGSNVTIMAGVKIGDGAVIGANALITKDVKPYSIVGGVPARIIKMRFDEETIIQLQKLKWWTWQEDKILKFSKFFNSPISFISNA